MSNTSMTDAFDGEDSEWSPAKPKNWPAFARQLERELNAAQQRIKRLEEAGDEMEKYCRDYYSSNRWYKAKEAKP